MRAPLILFGLIYLVLSKFVDEKFLKSPKTNVILSLSQTFGLYYLAGDDCVIRFSCLWKACVAFSPKLSTFVSDRNFTMKKIVLFYGRFVLLLTLAILIFAGVFTVPRIWGWEPLIVMSGSMEPTIPAGSVLFMNTWERDAETGDIITYYLETDKVGTGTLVTHRVVRSERSHYITKGDHNEQEDFVPVSYEQVLGTYLFYIPHAGWFISKLNRRLLIAAAFWLLLLNIVSILLNSMVQEE